MVRRLQITVMTRVIIGRGREIPFRSRLVNWISYWCDSKIPRLAAYIRRSDANIAPYKACYWLGISSTISQPINKARHVRKCRHILPPKTRWYSQTRLKQTWKTVWFEILKTISLSRSYAANRCMDGLLGGYHIFSVVIMHSNQSCITFVHRGRKKKKKELKEMDHCRKRKPYPWTVCWPCWSA